MNDELSAPTSYCPDVTCLSAGVFRDRTIRHTVRPNGTREWLLIYTIGGSGSYRSADGTYHSRPHDITLFPPVIPQDYQARQGSRWDLLFVHFLAKPQWLDWLDWPEENHGMRRLSVLDSTSRRQIIRSLRKTIRFWEGARPRREEFSMNALEETLLWCDEINPKRAIAGIDPRIQKAKEFLCTHLGEPFSQEKLATAAGLSSTRLRHLFSQQAGVSPRQFHEDQKMLRARQLLASSMYTISEIAQELGFEDPFYFTQRFKKETGKSPREFRKLAALG